MRRTWFAAILGLLAIAALGALATGTQGESTARSLGPSLRVLLVDETKTFASTMRVGALAGVLRRSGLAEVTVLLSDVGWSYGDPVAGRKDELDGPYDGIVIITRGIDDGTSDWIWIVANTPRGSSPDYPTFAAAIDALSLVIERVFSGLARAIDGREDLFPAFLAALHVQEGILR